MIKINNDVDLKKIKEKLISDYFDSQFDYIVFGTQVKKLTYKENEEHYNKRYTEECLSALSEEFKNIFIEKNNDKK